MTILGACVTKRSIYIGTDTQVNWGTAFCRPLEGGKFVETGVDDVIIAWSGHFRLRDIFQAMLRKKETSYLTDIHSKQQVEEMALSLHEHVQEVSQGKPKSGLPDLEFGCIVVTSRARKIWTIESDLAVIEYGDYACMGSGAQIGESVFYALDTVGITGERALKVALKTACARDPCCGGDVVVRKLPILKGR